MFLRSLSDEGKKLFYSLEIVLANADGVFDAKEESLIKSHCLEMGIEFTGKSDVSNELKDIIENINSSLSTKEKKIIFVELVAVALVDGEYHENEKKVIEEMRTVLQIPEEVANDAIELMNKLMEVTRSLQNFIEW